MNAVRWGFRLFCFMILAAATVTCVRGDETVAEQADEHALSSSNEGEVAKALESKRDSLEKKERELQEFEARLKDQEGKLDERMAKLERIRAEITGELESQRKANEEKVVKMVAVFETMTPKAAAGVMETLDDWLAVDILKRMETKRMAKVMNTMDKARSARLSELLTGYFNPATVKAKVEDRVVAGQAAPKGAEEKSKKGGKQ